MGARREQRRQSATTWGDGTSTQQAYCAGCGAECMHLVMAETSDDTYSDNDALGALYEAATEIGVVAEDIFKNATAALYAPYAESIRSIAEAERHCVQLQYDNHQRAL